MEERSWYVKSSDGAVYGPASDATLLEWVRDGRVSPSGYISTDRMNWVPPQSVDSLGMRWVVESADGAIFGPFHIDVVKRMLSEGSKYEGARFYRRWEGPVEEDTADGSSASPGSSPSSSLVVTDVVVEPVDDKPARSSFGGIFKDADPEQLAELEAAARKELFAAKKFGLGGIFGRKK